MAQIELGEVQEAFAHIVWEHEPVGSVASAFSRGGGSLKQSG